MFRDRRRLRRWATQMLLVWLFGIASGIAHACVLRVADHHHEIEAAAISHHESVASHDHHHHGSSQHVDEQANCLDFCEKSSVTAPSLKFKLDQSADSQSIAFHPSPQPWMADAAVLAPARWNGDTPHGGGPPMRIVFQRLAL